MASVTMMNSAILNVFSNAPKVLPSNSTHHLPRETHSIIVRFPTLEASFSQTHASLTISAPCYQQQAPLPPLITLHNNTFKRGDEVEVTSKFKAFSGSYYPATVIKPVGKGEYLVQFKTLLADDEEHMLREVVQEAQIRPSPPKLYGKDLLPGDTVDAFDNFSWRAGKLTTRNSNGYSVWFADMPNVVRYPHSRLRLHQEWRDGKWFLSRQQNKYCEL